MKLLAMRWGLLLFLLVVSSASADECGKLPTRAGVVGYCIHEADTAKNPDLLYYLHGAVAAQTRDVERSFERGLPELNALWRELHRAPPSTIAISWGPWWTLKGARIDAFALDIVPALEAKLPMLPDRRRLILGGSMGGLSAFIAWTHLPHLFNGAAFQCPAFTPVSPRASQESRYELARTWEGNPEDNVKVLDLIAIIFRRDFVSTQEWLEYQPPAAMRALTVRRLPPAYMVYNAHDSFGFNGAPEILASGQPITYEPLDGPHCAGINTVGLAKFLSRSLDASASR